MTALIGGCLAIGCILFTLSLPLRGLPLAGTLRRWSLFCFAAAFAPSIACSLAASAVGHGSESPSLGGVLAGIGLLAIVSVIAYVVLAVRGRVNGGKRNTAESWRDRRGYQIDAGPQRGWWDDGRE